MQSKSPTKASGTSRTPPTVSLAERIEKFARKPIFEGMIYEWFVEQRSGMVRGPHPTMMIRVPLKAIVKPMGWKIPEDFDLTRFRVQLPTASCVFLPNGKIDGRNTALAVMEPNSVKLPAIGRAATMKVSLPEKPKKAIKPESP